MRNNRKPKDRTKKRVQRTPQHAKERLLLPANQYRAEILKTIETNPVLIIVGETGCGKTTQIPQYFLEERIAKKKIAVTQPRRVAAITVAKRVSEEVGTKLGGTVGYSVRFDDCSSPSTRLKYLTDGMLLREAMLDKTLSQYSIVVLDEVHERTIATDVLLGLLKGIKATTRPDLKIVIMSATMDPSLFLRYFSPVCPVTTVMMEGRTFPVDMYYTPEPEPDVLDSTLITVLQIHLHEDPGDVLVFLPGQEDIENLFKLLKERIEKLPTTAAAMLLCPLFAALPREQQLAVFDPTPPGSRKVILSTNIAETSLTIPGIRFVVDSGLVKVVCADFADFDAFQLRMYQPSTGMDSLLVTPISKAQAWQRSGRAGREAPGKCYRLLTERDFLAELKATTPAEVLRVSLESVALQLATVGVGDILNFDFIQPPPRQSLARALERLLMLGALQTDQSITPLGRQMAVLPVDPVYALLLLKAVDFKCLEEALTLVSMLSSENIFYTPRGKREKATAARMGLLTHEGDHCTFVNTFRAWKAAGSDRVGWSKAHFVNHRALVKAQSIRNQLLGYCENLNLDVATTCGHDLTPLRRCLVAACFLQTARLVNAGVDTAAPSSKRSASASMHSAMYRTCVKNHLVRIHPASTLHHRTSPPEVIVFDEMVLTTKEYMRTVTEVEGHWLPELAPKVFRIARSGV